MAHGQGGFTLAEAIRWVIYTLTRMARDKAWGEIRITVQAGRIDTCHDHRSYRDRLPGGGPEVEAAIKQLTPDGSARNS
jgi:hypothetical protein